MKKTFNYDTYLERTHWIGRIVSVLTLVMLVGAPFAIGGILGAMPDLAAAGKGFLDAVRERNGNLPVSMGRVPEGRNEM